MGVYLAMIDQRHRHAEAGLVKLGVVALDGTKVAANAALAANRSYEKIEEEVRRMLEEAKRVDAEEDLLFGPEGREEAFHLDPDNPAAWVGLGAACFQQEKYLEAETEDDPVTDISQHRSGHG